ncbi:hypothetical protein CR513_53543, partial [Mucuna pruriens]
MLKVQIDSVTSSSSSVPSGSLENENSFSAFRDGLRVLIFDLETSLVCFSPNIEFHQNCKAGHPQLKATHNKLVLDFVETFSPVAKLTAVRILLSIAAQKSCSMLQLDINNVFLNGDLFEEEHMELPLRYHTTKGENLACKLNKFLYSPKQASREWLQKFSCAIISSGFTQSKIAESSKGTHLCQQKYTIQIQEDTGFASAKPANLPMDPNLKLNDIDDEPLPNSGEEGKNVQNTSNNSDAEGLKFGSLSPQIYA